MSFPLISAGHGKNPEADLHPMPEDQPHPRGKLAGFSTHLLRGSLFFSLQALFESGGLLGRPSRLGDVENLREPCLIRNSCRSGMTSRILISRW
jgi:hypothetical protein